MTVPSETIYFEMLLISLAGIAISVWAFWYIWKRRTHWLVMPSLLILAWYFIRIQVPSVFWIDEAIRLLPNPREYVIIVHGFSVFFLATAVFVYPLFTRTSRAVWKRIREPRTDIVADNAVLLPPLALLTALVLAWYLISVPFSQTGLYALLTEPMNLRTAREDSLKLISSVPLKYAFTWLINTVSPVLIAICTLRLLTGRSKLISIAILVLAVLPLIMTGSRSGFFTAGMIAVIAWFLTRRTLNIPVLRLAAALVALSMLPALITLLREGRDFNLDTFWTYMQTIAVGRIFETPTRVGLWYMHFAQNQGFLGVSTIRPITMITGQEFVNLPSLIAHIYMSTTASALSNANFLFSYYVSFGPIGTILIGFAGLYVFDIIIIPVVKRFPRFAFPIFILLTIKASSLSEGVFTTSFVTGGYFLIPLIAMSQLLYNRNSRKLTRRGASARPSTWPQQAE